MHSGGIFDYTTKHERLIEVKRELEEPELWNKQEKAQALGRERAILEKVVQTIEQLDIGLMDGRQKRAYRRLNGERIAFEDNAVAILKDEKGNPKGTQIKGAVAREVLERWPQVAKIASSIY